MQGENTSGIKHYQFNPETEALSYRSDALQWKAELVLIRLPDYRQGKCEDFFRASFLFQMKWHQDGLERHILQRIKSSSGSDKQTNFRNAQLLQLFMHKTFKLLRFHK